MSEANFITTIEDADCEEAYEKLLPEAKALEADQLSPITLDIPSAIVTVVGVLPKLKAIHEQASKLPAFDVSAFEKLSSYALALASAHARYVSATTPPEQLPELLESATERRDIFLADAHALVARGLLNGESLREYKGMHGYKNVAFDLMGIVQLLKSTWPHIEGHTGIKYNELVEANKLALKLVSAIAHREQSPEQEAAATDIRQRMFVLFCKAYEQVRRATLFLRWNEGDADEIAPSLFAGRANSNIRKPAVPSASAIGPSVPGPGVTAPGATAAALAGTATPETNKVPVGMPGGNPLMNG